MPRKVFTAGEVLAAADVNTYLMNQAVMTFAGSAARSSAIGSATEGMVTYLADSDTFQFWNGTAYASLAPAVPTMQYLVIGGGGGGAVISGNEHGGGGGAGGYRTNVTGQLSGGSVTAEPAFPLTRGTAYAIIVGAGGSGGNGSSYVPGVPGTRSAFGIVTSQGGGGGRSRFSAEFPQGGSGSGGTMHVPPAGTGIVGEGFNGGTGPSSNTILGAGGGGGAGAIGVSTNVNAGGAGGAGLSNNITGTSVTRGGGGGGGGQTSGGAGGAGGGAPGSMQNVARANGTANTGGGGGGGSNTGGGNGGSGVAILSVPSSITATFSGGVTQTNSIVGANRVYVVTATSTTSETVTFS